jgi:hypothetical protein
MKFTPQQLRERYLKLPKDVQDAIFSVDSAEIIQDIANKNNLVIDKMGELADETGLVMLGITKPSEYVKNLTGRLGIDSNTAQKIGDEINSRIFSPIRESLKEIYGEEKKIEEKIPEKPSFVIETKKEEEKIPEIIQGSNLPQTAPINPVPTMSPNPNPSTQQPTINPFEEKTKEGVFKTLREEKKYDGNDPYREPIDPKDKKT